MQKLLAYIKIMRPLNVVIGVIGVLLGADLTGHLAVNNIFWLTILTVVTFTGAANAINDYYDYEIDRINRPGRPIPSGKISRNGARIFAYVLFITGLIASAIIRFQPFLLAAISVILLVGYSRWWKRQPIIGNVVVSIMIAVAFFYGASAFGHLWAAWPPAFIGFVYTWGREMIKDLEDVEGDAVKQAKTLPLLAGEIPAKLIASLLFLILIFGVLVPYFLNIYNVYYLLTVVVGVNVPIVYITTQLWRSKTAKEYRRLSQILKVDMFVGLLAVFVGTL